MERKVIIEAFNRRFSKLDHSMEKLKIHFSPDGIHKFRIEVKKLKALVRLMKEGKAHKAHFEIPKGIRRLYKATGNVRNLQLREKHLSATISKKDWRLPDSYYKEFSSEKYDALDHAKKIIDRKGTPGKWKANISSFLLNKKGRVNIKRFVGAESERLLQLLEMNQPTDKSLHKLRKLIKNILYTWPFIRREASMLFPSGFRSYNYFKLLSDLLGQFHDVCVDLAHLDSNISDRSSFPKENKVLIDIKSEWQLKKANILQVLEAKLNANRDSGPEQE